MHFNPSIGERQDRFTIEQTPRTTRFGIEQRFENVALGDDTNHFTIFVDDHRRTPQLGAELCQQVRQGATPGEVNDGLCEPFEVYRTLRVVNPSPFMFYVRTPAVTLVGSSPEVMCRVMDGITTVRPLAGTRPRGKSKREDEQLAEELLADPKERAEHVMLVDLGRNDVGRVAKYGTIELSDVMCVERYSHVMHISSNVQGELREDLTAMDALKACLPAGTVSGAPKVRAMEIIDEIEPHRRGPYAGAVGYIDYSGNMDTCIALRTLVFAGDKIYIQAGAGIVADSQPSLEYQETLNKAGAMLKAIEATVARASAN